ncbi:MAG: type IV pilus assembly protein PilM [Planctomycetaceae bacterium]|nr:MAG: type IV pilus assembly protein PilM [Planctomycetaceae bacterium]
MASNGSVWGIEIGQAALKALRCHREGDDIVADAFDYIEYPKLLSQPEADPTELVAEALAKFRERDDARGHQICMSVPGQTGLSKFFSPPPVELKKLPDLVKYEAKQQIPFDLEDVVWDYQMMPGSTIEEGYALESEVGLFAMKREMVYRQLQPLDRAGVEIDLIQLAPIALYNMLAFDRMHDRIEENAFVADAPPSSTVLLSIGTDSSDLIVSNGFRIWQRSMPIGGNHFTRQLTKDLKLTFAQAEHLKRNARDAADPKLIFQTMRPVFNDLVTEIQRSIGFYRSLNRKAEISELLISGNTVKMPGLAAYIGKNLDLEVHVLDRFNRLGGEDVLSIPSFRDNAPTYAVCYGLCLQGLGVSQLRNSLVPREIVVKRIIRAKKPWAVVTLATLMIGMSAHYWSAQRTWAKTHPDLWGRASSAVSTMSSYSSQQVSEDDKLKSKLKYLDVLGHEVSSNSERRLQWLEILRGLNAAVPRTAYPDGKPPSPKELPFEDRMDIHITEIESKRFEDLAEWFSEKRAVRYREEVRNWARVTGNPVPEDLATTTGPTGPGWVFELRGYHYYNSPKRLGSEGSNHVRKYLITNLMSKPIPLPGPDGEIIDFLPDELGLSFPLLLNDDKPKSVKIPNPDFDPETMRRPGGGGGGMPGEFDAGEDEGFAGGPAGGPAAGRTRGVGPDGKKLEPPELDVLRHDFIVQVVWQPNTMSERMQIRAEKLEAEKALEDQEGGEGEMVEDADSVAAR